jgi:chorismate mutase
MDDVASVKKARSIPVNDPVREAQLLDTMAALAMESNLPEEPVRKFFSGQMVAAKERQEEWLRENASIEQGQKTVPDLTKTIRPALDLIGRKMIHALARARKSGASPAVIAEAARRLEKAGFSRAVMTPAIQGLEAGLGVKK